MDRRNFLKTLAAGLVGATLDVDTVMSATNHMKDDEFLFYVTYSWNVILLNPAASVRISSIEDDDIPR